MAAKKKSKTVAKKVTQSVPVKKGQSFWVKEWHKYHTLGLIVAILLGITAILLFITYFSNNT